MKPFIPHMNYRKRFTLFALIGLAGMMVMSLPFTGESAPLYVISSWGKPLCVLLFTFGLGYYYIKAFRDSPFLSSLISLLITGFFFLCGFLIDSFFLRRINTLFIGVHSYILVPSLVAAILMSPFSLSRRITIGPLTSVSDAFCFTLLPFYGTVILSLLFSFIPTVNPALHWLSSDYIMKPAVQKEVKLPDRLIHEDIIYAGPLDIEYSREFINIYRKVNSSPDLRDGTASIADYGVFSNTFLFLIRNENEGELLVYSQDGQLVRNVESIDGIFHSGSVLAVVNADARTITVLDRELKTLFTITYPPSLSVEKIVFSHELLAVLYEKSAGSSEHFSMIYRLDSGSRVGKVNSADIAPRLKKTGFIAVETRDDGLYVTALDQNSNKQSYLFKGGGFQKALIRQCGGDRYFVKALQIENDAVKSEFVMVHDFFRYRRLAAATREGSDPGDDHGNIIAVIGDYFLTDADYLLDRNLKSVYSIAPPHSVPFRLLPSGDTGTSLSAEGSVAGIDFTPLLSGLGKDARKNLLLADVKGTLFVKEIFSFLGHFVVVTPRLILIYNGDLELEKKIELPGNGHIDIVRILNESVFFTFDSSEDISIYSIDGNFSETRIAVINAPQGKIWDISDKWIIYGHDPESAPAGTGRPGRASILIAKGIGSNRMYERVLSLPLHDAPSLVKNSLILPFEDLTELIELSSGKRTVFDGNLYRGGSLPFGFTNTGYVVDLPALEAFPYRFDPERVHAPVSSIGQWIDMGEYLLNVGSGQVYEIIRSGVTTLGENSVCSVSGLRNKKVLNCLDLDTKSITVTLSLDGTYESAYSDPDLIFVHDSHSLVTIRNNTEGN